jgi:NAD(P)-dependent dehydrogenase (short-subunit alcohol dehydrogenase family)
VIVNNGSDWSVVASADAFPYITSKGAVGQMTKAMAMDYAPEGIRVNAVCPGDTIVERWLEDGYFEGSGAVTMEEALKESAEHIPMGRCRERSPGGAVLASNDSSFMTRHLLRGRRALTRRPDICSRRAPLTRHAGRLWLNL